MSDLINTANASSALTTGSTQIWYWRPELARDFLMGPRFIKEHNINFDPKNLAKTHILLGTIPETDPEDVFHYMQGEVWSPNGEARPIIQGKGLSHTSMSVGDVMVIGGEVIMVDMFGFSNAFGFIDINGTEELPDATINAPRLKDIN